MFLHNHGKMHQCAFSGHYHARMAAARHLGAILETGSHRSRDTVIRNEANLTNSEPVGGISASNSTGAETSGAGDGKGDDSEGDDPDSDRRLETHSKPPCKVRRKRASVVLPLPPTGWVRLPQILAVIPVGKSTWWAGCRSGRFPAPIRLSPGITVWRAEDIHALIGSL